MPWKSLDSSIMTSSTQHMFKLFTSLEYTHSDMLLCNYVISDKVILHLMPWFGTIKPRIYHNEKLVDPWKREDNATQSYPKPSPFFWISVQLRHAITHLFNQELRDRACCCLLTQASGSRLNIKMLSYQYRNPHVKIRRSRDHIIFNMGIPIPGKDGLYTGTGPRREGLLISSVCMGDRKSELE